MNTTPTDFSNDNNAAATGGRSRRSGGAEGGTSPTSNSRVRRRRRGDDYEGIADYEAQRQQHASSSGFGGVPQHQIFSQQQPLLQQQQQQQFAFQQQQQQQPMDFLQQQQQYQYFQQQLLQSHQQQQQLLAYFQQQQQQQGGGGGGQQQQQLDPLQVQQVLLMYQQQQLQIQMQMQALVQQQQQQQGQQNPSSPSSAMVPPPMMMAPPPLPPPQHHHQSLPRHPVAMAVGNPSSALDVRRSSSSNRGVGGRGNHNANNDPHYYNSDSGTATFTNSTAYEGSGGGGGGGGAGLESASDNNSSSAMGTARTNGSSVPSSARGMGMGGGGGGARSRITTSVFDGIADDLNAPPPPQPPQHPLLHHQSPSSYPPHRAGSFNNNTNTNTINTIATTASQRTVSSGEFGGVVVGAAVPSPPQQQQSSNAPSRGRPLRESAYTQHRGATIGGGGGATHHRGGEGEDGASDDGSDSYDGGYDGHKAQLDASRRLRQKRAEHDTNNATRGGGQQREKGGGGGAAVPSSSGMAEVLSPHTAAARVSSNDANNRRRGTGGDLQSPRPIHMGGTHQHQHQQSPQNGDRVMVEDAPNAAPVIIDGGGGGAAAVGGGRAASASPRHSGQVLAREQQQHETATAVTVTAQHGNDSRREDADQQNNNNNNKAAVAAKALPASPSTGKSAAPPAAPLPPPPPEATTTDNFIAADPMTTDVNVEEPITNNNHNHHNNNGDGNNNIGGGGAGGGGAAAAANNKAPLTVRERLRNFTKDRYIVPEELLWKGYEPRDIREFIDEAVRIPVYMVRFVNHWGTEREFQVSEYGKSSNLIQSALVLIVVGLIIDVIMRATDSFNAMRDHQYGGSAGSDVFSHTDFLAGSLHYSEVIALGIAIVLLILEVVRHRMGRGYVAQLDARKLKASVYNRRMFRLVIAGEVIASLVAILILSIFLFEVVVVSSPDCGSFQIVGGGKTRMVSRRINYNFDTFVNLSDINATAQFSSGGDGVTTAAVILSLSEEEEAASPLVYSLTNYTISSSLTVDNDPKVAFFCSHYHIPSLELAAAMVIISRRPFQFHAAVLFVVLVALEFFIKAYDGDTSQADAYDPSVVSEEGGARYFDAALYGSGGRVGKMFPNNGINYRFPLDTILSAILVVIILALQAFAERSTRIAFANRKRESAKIAQLRFEQAQMQKYVEELVPKMVSQRILNYQQSIANGGASGGGGGNGSGAPKKGVATRLASLHNMGDVDFNYNTAVLAVGLVNYIQFANSYLPGRVAVSTAYVFASVSEVLSTVYVPKTTARHHQDSTQGLPYFVTHTGDDFIAVFGLGRQALGGAPFGILASAEAACVQRSILDACTYLHQLILVDDAMRAHSLETLEPRPQLSFAVHCGAVMGEIPGKSAITWRYGVGGQGVTVARRMLRFTNGRRRRVLVSQSVVDRLEEAVLEIPDRKPCAVPLYETAEVPPWILNPAAAAAGGGGGEGAANNNSSSNSHVVVGNAFLGDRRQSYTMLIGSGSGGGGNNSTNPLLNSRGGGGGGGGRRSAAAKKRFGGVLTTAEVARAERLTKIARLASSNTTGSNTTNGANGANGGPFSPISGRTTARPNYYNNGRGGGIVEQQQQQQYPNNSYYGGAGGGQMNALNNTGSVFNNLPQQQTVVPQLNMANLAAANSNNNTSAAAAPSPPSVGGVVPQTILAYASVVIDLQFTPNFYPSKPLKVSAGGGGGGGSADLYNASGGGIFSDGMGGLGGGNLMNHGANNTNSANGYFNNNNTSITTHAVPANNGNIVGAGGYANPLANHGHTAHHTTAADTDAAMGASDDRALAMHGLVAGEGAAGSAYGSRGGGGGGNTNNANPTADEDLLAGFAAGAFNLSVAGGAGLSLVKHDTGYGGIGGGGNDDWINSIVERSITQNGASRSRGGQHMTARSRRARKAAAARRRGGGGDGAGGVINPNLTSVTSMGYQGMSESAYRRPGDGDDADNAAMGPSDDDEEDEGLLGGAFSVGGGVVGGGTSAAAGSGGGLGINRRVKVGNILPELLTETVKHSNAVLSSTIKQGVEGPYRLHPAWGLKWVKKVQNFLKTLFCSACTESSPTARAAEAFRRQQQAEEEERKKKAQRANVMATRSSALRGGRALSTGAMVDNAVANGTAGDSGGHTAVVNVPTPPLVSSGSGAANGGAGGGGGNNTNNDDASALADDNAAYNDAGSDKGGGGSGASCWSRGCLRPIASAVRRWWREAHYILRRAVTPRAFVDPKIEQDYWLRHLFTKICMRPFVVSQIGYIAACLWAMIVSLVDVLVILRSEVKDANRSALEAEAFFYNAALGNIVVVVDNSSSEGGGSANSRVAARRPYYATVPRKLRPPPPPPDHSSNDSSGSRRSFASSSQQQANGEGDAEPDHFTTRRRALAGLDGLLPTFPGPTSSGNRTDGANGNTAGPAPPFPPLLRDPTGAPPPSRVYYAAVLSPYATRTTDANAGIVPADASVPNPHRHYLSAWADSYRDLGTVQRVPMPPNTTTAPVNGTAEATTAEPPSSSSSTLVVLGNADYRYVGPFDADAANANADATVADDDVSSSSADRAPSSSSGVGASLGTSPFSSSSLLREYRYDYGFTAATPDELDAINAYLNDVNTLGDLLHFEARFYVAIVFFVLSMVSAAWSIALRRAAVRKIREGVTFPEDDPSSADGGGGDGINNTANAAAGGAGGRSAGLLGGRGFIIRPRRTAAAVGGVGGGPNDTGSEMPAMQFSTATAANARAAGSIRGSNHNFHASGGGGSAVGGSGTTVTANGSVRGGAAMGRSFRVTGIAEDGSVIIGTSGGAVAMADDDDLLDEDGLTPAEAARLRQQRKLRFEVYMSVYVLPIVTPTFLFLATFLTYPSRLSLDCFPIVILYCVLVPFVAWPMPYIIRSLVLNLFVIIPLALGFSLLPASFFSRPYVVCLIFLTVGTFLQRNQQDRGERSAYIRLRLRADYSSALARQQDARRAVMETAIPAPLRKLFDNLRKVAKNPQDIMGGGANSNSEEKESNPAAAEEAAGGGPNDGATAAAGNSKKNAPNNGGEGGAANAATPGGAAATPQQDAAANGQPQSGGNAPAASPEGGGAATGANGNSDSPAAAAAQQGNGAQQQQTDNQQQQQQPPQQQQQQQGIVMSAVDVAIAVVTIIRFDSFHTPQLSELAGKLYNTTRDRRLYIAGIRNVMDGQNATSTFMGIVDATLRDFPLLTVMEVRGDEVLVGGPWITPTGDEALALEEDATKERQKGGKKNSNNKADDGAAAEGVVADAAAAKKDGDKPPSAATAAAAGATTATATHQNSQQQTTTTAAAETEEDRRKKSLAKAAHRMAYAQRHAEQTLLFILQLRDTVRYIMNQSTLTAVEEVDGVGGLGGGEYSSDGGNGDTSTTTRTVSRAHPLGIALPSAAAPNGSPLSPAAAATQHTSQQQHQHHNVGSSHLTAAALGAGNKAPASNNNSFNTNKSANHTTTASTSDYDHASNDPTGAAHLSAADRKRERQPPPLNNSSAGGGGLTAVVNALSPGGSAVYGRGGDVSADQQSNPSSHAGVAAAAAAVGGGGGAHHNPNNSSQQSVVVSPTSDGGGAGTATVDSDTMTSHHHQQQQQNSTAATDNPNGHQHNPQNLSVTISPATNISASPVAAGGDAPLNGAGGVGVGAEQQQLLPNQVAAGGGASPQGAGHHHHGDAGTVAMVAGITTSPSTGSPDPLLFSSNNANNSPSSALTFQQQQYAGGDVSFTSLGAAAAEQLRLARQSLALPTPTVTIGGGGGGLTSALAVGGSHRNATGAKRVVVAVGGNATSGSNSNNVGASAAPPPPAYTFTAIATADDAIIMLRNSLYPSFDVLGTGPLRARELMRAAAPGTIAFTEGFRDVLVSNTATSIAAKLKKPLLKPPSPPASPHRRRHRRRRDPPQQQRRGDGHPDVFDDDDGSDDDDDLAGDESIGERPFYVHTFERSTTAFPTNGAALLPNSDVDDDDDTYSARGGDAEDDGYHHGDTNHHSNHLPISIATAPHDTDALERAIVPFAGGRSRWRVGGLAMVRMWAPRD